MQPMHNIPEHLTNMLELCLESEMTDWLSVNTNKNSQSISRNYVEIIFLNFARLLKSILKW